MTSTPISEEATRHRLEVDTALAQGAGAAFDSLYDLYADRLYRFLLRLTAGDRDLSDDLFQDTWVVALRRIDHFEGRAPFFSWLAGIAVNKLRRARELRWPEPLSEPQPEPPAALVTLPRRLERMDVESILEQLPEGYRAALVLHSEGFNHTEIGALLGIARGTSKSQLSRARRAARKLAQEVRR